MYSSLIKIFKVKDEKITAIATHKTTELKKMVANKDELLEKLQRELKEIELENIDIKERRRE